MIAMKRGKLCIRLKCLEKNLSLDIVMAMEHMKLKHVERMKLCTLMLLEEIGLVGR